MPGKMQANIQKICDHAAMKTLAPNWYPLVHILGRLGGYSAVIAIKRKKKLLCKGTIDMVCK